MTFDGFSKLSLFHSSGLVPCHPWFQGRWQPLGKLRQEKPGFAQKQGRSAHSPCWSRKPQAPGVSAPPPTKLLPQDAQPRPQGLSCPPPPVPREPCWAPQPETQSGVGPGQAVFPPPLSERGGLPLHPLPPQKSALVRLPVWLRDQAKVSATKKGRGKERAGQLARVPGTAGNSSQPAGPPALHTPPRG